MEQQIASSKGRNIRLELKRLVPDFSFPSIVVVVQNNYIVVWSKVNMDMVKITGSSNVYAENVKLRIELFCVGKVQNCP
jgi:hypothetical protein